MASMLRLHSLFGRAAGAGLALAAWLLAGCGGPAPTTETKATETAAAPPASATAVLRDPAAAGLPVVRLMTDWYAQPEHGGFYAAVALGYYREAGLDVHITDGGLGARPAEMLALGKVDLTFARSDDIMLLAAQGNDVRIVMGMMQHDPQGLMVHEASPVRTLRDLDGQTVMAGIGFAWTDYVQQTLGIRFNLIPNDYALARFAADPTLVKQCFLTNEPYFVRQAGTAVRVIPVSESGFDAYRVIYGNQPWLAAHGDQTRAFVAASIRGWQAYLAEGQRAGADAWIVQQNPAMTPEFIAFSVGALREYGIIEGKPGTGNAIGLLRPSRLEAMMKAYRQLGRLDRDIPWSAYASLDYLPPSLRPMAL